MGKFTDDDIEKYFLLKSEMSKGCMMCKDPTHFIEITSEARFCSKECHDKFYDDYKKWLDSMGNEEL